MKIKFKTFEPTVTFMGSHNVRRSATINLNDWLEENHNVEVISWQTCAVGKDNELYITIQYREWEE